MPSVCCILIIGPCTFEKAVCSVGLWFTLDFCKLGQNCVSIYCFFQKQYILSDFGLLVPAITRACAQISHVCGFDYVFVVFCPFCFIYFEARRLYANKFRIALSSCSTDPIIIMKYPSLCLVMLFSLKTTLLDINTID